MRPTGCQSGLVGHELRGCSVNSRSRGRTTRRRIVTGTSEFSLGQNGAIGHRTARFRSLPFARAVDHRGGWRTWGDSEWAAIRDGECVRPTVCLTCRAPDRSSRSHRCPRSSWARPLLRKTSPTKTKNDDNAVTTSCHGARKSITTDDWFYVRPRCDRHDPDSTSPG